MPERHRPFSSHPAAASHPTIVSNARVFLSLAIGDSTRQAYTSGVNSYLKFVGLLKIRPAFPASIDTLCLWIASIAAPPHNLKVGTCKVYLSGVINQHLEQGFHNPIEDAPPMLDRIFTGIKRYSAMKPINNVTNNRKLPITTAMLRRMQPLLHCIHRSDALVLAMMWLATTAMLRISEFTAGNKDREHILSLSQLTFINVHNQILNSLVVNQASRIKHAVLHLSQSKSDPFRKGVDIIIATPETLEALKGFLSHPKNHRRGLSDPLFTFRDNTAVTRQWFMQQVSSLLTKTGYNTLHYSSHSFRKGGAVSLQHSGATDSIIRRMGRWQSDAYHRYVKDPMNDTIIHAAKLM